MSNSGPQPDEMSLQQEQQIDAICGGFEAAWQAGTEPDIETHLPEDSGVRLRLLSELIQIDLERRLSSEPTVRLESYLARFF